MDESETILSRLLIVAMDVTQDDNTAQLVVSSPDNMERPDGQRGANTLHSTVGVVVYFTTDRAYILGVWWLLYEISGQNQHYLYN